MKNEQLINLIGEVILLSKDLIKESVREVIKEEMRALSPNVDSKKVIDIATKKAEKVSKDTIEEEVADEEVEGVAKNVEELNYNDLKAYAKELGLSAKGTKKDLIDRIKEHLDTDEEPKEVEVKVKATVKDVEDVKDEEVEDTTTDEEEEDLELGELLAELKIKDLKELAKKLKIKVPLKATAQKIIDKILREGEDLEVDTVVEFLIEKGIISEDDIEEDEEDIEEEESVDEEESEEDENDLDVEAFISDFELADLKNVAKKLNIKFPAKIKADKLRALILEQKEESIVDVLVDLQYLSFEVEEDEEEVDEEEESDVEGEENPYAEIEELDDEDLKAILESLGKSTRGKHQALVSKVTQLLIDGELEMSDIFEDEEDTNEDEEEVEIEEDEESSEVRRIAQDELRKELKQAIKDKEITPKEMKKFLNEVFNDEYEGTSKDIVRDYIDVQCELLDDEGEQHDLSEPYFVGDEVYCCGHPVANVDDELYCEHCGSEIEVE